MVRHPTHRSITYLISPCRETVQSVGLISKHLPFCNSNNAILHFRHALGLDERRVKYIPSFYFDGEPGSQRDEVQINDLDGSETDVEEVFFAGVHCGTFRSSYIQRICYLQMPFQISEVDL